MDVNANKEKAIVTDGECHEHIVGLDRKETLTVSGPDKDSRIHAKNFEIRGCDNIKSPDWASGDNQVSDKTCTSTDEERGAKPVPSGEVKDDKPVNNVGKGEIMGTVFTSRNFTVKLQNRELCRFQLTGPLSQAVLARTLEIANISVPSSVKEIIGGNVIEQVNANDKIKLDQSPDCSISVGKQNTIHIDRSIGNKLKLLTDSGNHLEPPLDDKIVSKPLPEGLKWWQKHYREGTASEIHEKQSRMWRHLTGILSPAQLPPHCSLGLTVTDPRLQLPAKRGKTYLDIEGMKTSVELPGLFPC